MIKKFMSTIYKILTFFLMFQILVVGFSFKINAEENFETWLSSYKKFALKKGVSQNTIDIAFKNVKFLEQVIKYDRKQPEFFEDTKTYVDKRANITRVRTARKLLKENKLTLKDIDVFEIHEAFAGQILANLNALNSDYFCKNSLNSDKIGEIPIDKLNLWGGSLAIGHPLAASNIRNIMTSVNRLENENKEIALVAACADSGLANAMLIKRT